MNQVIQPKNLKDVHTQKLYRASNYDKGDILYDQFQIISVLGRGISKVYKVDLLETTFDNKKVGALKVVKFMNERMQNNEKYLSYSWRLAKYFRLEMLILKELIKLGVKNVVKVYHVYFSDDRTAGFILMEKLDYTLHQYIQKQKGKLNEQEMIKLFYEVSLGIRELHQYQIMHRDVKPRNIVWDGINKVWKVIDLGFAKIFVGDSYGDHTNLGSTQTKAPQFFLNNADNEGKLKYCSKIDVWSLGVVYYYIVTGQYLFEFQNKIYMKEFEQKIDREFGQDSKQSVIRKLGCSERIIRFIKDILVIDREKRPDIKKLFEHEIFKEELNQKIEGETNLAYATTKISTFSSQIESIPSDVLKQPKQLQVFDPEQFQVLKIVKKQNEN